MIHVRQTTITAAQAEATRAVAVAQLLELGLRPDDTIRFARTAGTGSKVEGRPLDVAVDGSVTCFAGGKMRAIAQEMIEVKTVGPRGGTRWVPLVPEESGE